MAETIRVGINASHPDTRVSQMMAFGRDKVLERADILKVATYVHALSSKDSTLAATLAEGKAVFDANCVACHGDDARGKRDVGDLRLARAGIGKRNIRDWHGRIGPFRQPASGCGRAGAG